MVNRKEKGIPLSPKHGLNPSVVYCPICGKDTGIALMGKMKGDAEAPHKVQGDLCEDCAKDYITICEAEPRKRKPKLTGRAVFLKREVIAEKFRNEKTVLMSPDEFESLYNRVKEEQANARGDNDK